MKRRRGQYSYQRQMQAQGDVIVDFGNWLTDRLTRLWMWLRKR
jgi:hypothetical protein